MWKVGPSLAHTSPHHESTRTHTPLIPDSRPFGGGLASSHIWFDKSGTTVLPQQVLGEYNRVSVLQLHYATPKMKKFKKKSDKKSIESDGLLDDEATP